MNEIFNPIMRAINISLGLLLTSDYDPCGFRKYYGINRNSKWGLVKPNASLTRRIFETDDISIFETDFEKTETFKN